MAEVALVHGLTLQAAMQAQTLAVAEAVAPTTIQITTVVMADQVLLLLDIIQLILPKKQHKVQ